MSPQSARGNRSIDCRRVTASHDRGEAVVEQPQIREPLSRCGKAANRQIQLATIQVFGKIERATRTYVEIDPWRLCSNGGSEWSGKDDRGTIVHREREAALGIFRVERGCAVEGGLQALQRRADRSNQPLGVGCRLHAVR